LDQLTLDSLLEAQSRKKLEEKIEQPIIREIPQAEPEKTASKDLFDNAVEIFDLQSIEGRRKRKFLRRIYREAFDEIKDYSKRHLGIKEGAWKTLDNLGKEVRVKQESGKDELAPFAEVSKVKTIKDKVEIMPTANDGKNRIIEKTEKKNDVEAKKGDKTPETKININSRKNDEINIDLPQEFRSIPRLITPSTIKGWVNQGLSELQITYKIFDSIIRRYIRDEKELNVELLKDIHVSLPNKE
jgi:hypothetical protein